MTARSLSLLPILALLCGGAVVVGMPTLRPHRPAAPAPAALAHIDEDPTEFPPHAHRAAAAAAATTARPTIRRGRADPIRVRARIEADVALLDARFAAEPLDATWARREEHALDAFFATDALRAQGLPVPAGLQTACHSATCKVSARFADPIEAEAITRRLAVHLSARLPYGATLPRTQDDGSVQVDAWYSTQRIVL